MIRTLLMIAVGTVFLVSAPVIFSHNPERYDFPKEEVEKARKQLDQFFESAKASYQLPFSLSEKEKTDLVEKYLGEANKSPYFWANLAETLRTVRNNMPSGSLPTPEHEKAAYVVRGSYWTVMAQRWGTLALSSEPKGAEVFLKLSAGRTNEGKTRINRRYPEGDYVFVVEMTGYKSKEVPVTIDKDKPVEENVMLEKQ